MEWYTKAVDRPSVIGTETMDFFPFFCRCHVGFLEQTVATCSLARRISCHVNKAAMTQLQRDQLDLKMKKHPRKSRMKHWTNRGWRLPAPPSSGGMCSAYVCIRLLQDQGRWEVKYIFTTSKGIQRVSSSQVLLIKCTSLFIIKCEHLCKCSLVVYSIQVC